MFGTNVTGSGLTFGKVLGGISKTLSIANQVIPLYQQAKPMINNAKTIMNVLKGLKTDNKPIKKTTNINQDIKEVKYKEIKQQTNSPTFFQ